MGINYGDNKIGKVYVGSQPIKEVYKGSDLIWQAHDFFTMLMIFDENESLHRYRLKDETIEYEASEPDALNTNTWVGTGLVFGGNGNVYITGDNEGMSIKRINAANMSDIKSISELFGSTFSYTNACFIPMEAGGQKGIVAAGTGSSDDSIKLLSTDLETELVTFSNFDDACSNTGAIEWGPDGYLYRGDLYGRVCRYEVYYDIFDGWQVKTTNDSFEMGDGSWGTAQITFCREPGQTFLIACTTEGYIYRAEVSDLANTYEQVMDTSSSFGLPRGNPLATHSLNKNHSYLTGGENDQDNNRFFQMEPDFSSIQQIIDEGMDFTPRCLAPITVPGNIPVLFAGKEPFEDSGIALTYWDVSGHYFYNEGGDDGDEKLNALQPVHWFDVWNWEYDEDGVVTNFND